MASLQLGLQHSVSTGCAPVEFTEKEGEKDVQRGGGGIGGGERRRGGEEGKGGEEGRRREEVGGGGWVKGRQWEREGWE